jgi:hypothetical protein
MRTQRNVRRHEPAPPIGGDLSYWSTVPPGDARPGLSDPDPNVRLRAALLPPHTWHVDGIDAFWIESDDGSALSPEFADTGPAYEAARPMLVAAGKPEAIALIGRRPDGRTVELMRGAFLLDIAEAHLGLPARSRRPDAIHPVTAEPSPARGSDS